RGHRLLCAGGVLALLEHAPGVARGRRGAADVRDADRFPSEEAAEDRGADRDRRLHASLGDLAALPRLRLLGAPQALVERRALRRVLFSEGVDARVAVGARGLADSHAEVALALTRARDRAGRGVAEELEAPLPVEPRRQVPAPVLVALGLGPGRGER